MTANEQTTDITVKTKKNEDVYLAVALARGLKVLHLLADARTPLPLAEISRQLNLTRGVAFRLVHTLEVEGYIERVDQIPSYRAAAKVLSLGQSYLQSLGMPELARIDLEQLRNSTEASVHLAVLDKTEVVYVSRLPAKEGGADYLEIGDRSPAHASAIGLAMLAHLSDQEIQELYQQKEMPHFMTAAQRDELIAKLEAVRSNGYSCSVGALYPNVFAVASAILDGKGALAGAVSVTTLDPNAQQKAEFLSTNIVATAQKISEKLGFRQ